MFRRIIAFMLLFFFAGNAFAVDVQTIKLQDQKEAARKSSEQKNTVPDLQQQFQQIQKQLQQIQSQLDSDQGNKTSAGNLQNESALNGSSQPKAAEKISEIEQFFDRETPIANSVSTIKQFGYDLFNNPVTTFAPGNEVPVTPDYVIGPGDEIKIDIWGKVSGSWAVVVDKDGNLSIPELGSFGVTGLTFRELKGVLKKKFSKYYTGFEMNVTMGSLKSIRIYIVGNAKMPGAYTVSSLSTLLSALFECGGPSKNGSMRNIQLKRGDKVITTLDLYDFLLKGDKSNDARLLPGDVIFIPAIGPVAGVEGNVKRPAIYELKNGTKISDLLKMANGITPEGYLQDVQLERVRDNEIKTLIDTNFKSIGQKTDLVVKDGDLLNVRAINNKLANAVALEGNVIRPGRYQWFKGMRISDLITDTEKDLSADTDFDIAVIERRVPPDFHKEFYSFNLGKALFDKKEVENKLLEPYDIVHIYSKWNFQNKPVVLIAGAVNAPGKYEFTPNMKVSDLVSMAGGLKRYAFANQMELTRVNITNSGPVTERIHINIEKALQNDAENNIALKQDDYLFIRTVPDWRLYRTVTLSGEVRFPGTYSIKRGETLSSLIDRAGGYTKEAYLEGAVFTRKSVQEMQQKSIDEMVQRLQSELSASQSVQMSNTLSQDEVTARQGQIAAQKQFLESLKNLKATGRMVIALSDLKSLTGSMYDIELEDGDTLYMPAKNSVVNVVGAVMSGTTSLVYSKDLGGKDYVKLAGGYAEHADKDHVYVLKADGSARRLSGSGITWNSSRHRWETGSVVISSGDTIVVPEELEQVSWLQGVRDITTILMNIAVTAGVVIKIL